ncbi:EamA family transporter [Actinomadura sp. NPDC000600]|uniref:EamA family transporter n=1 Tax=Actinomadura sp. NPDC000600 TaxID=3154262 RepID=UPI003393BB05
MSGRWWNGLLGGWVALTLGVPFLLIAIAGRALPADVLACARFGLAGLTLLAVMAARGGGPAAVAALSRLARHRPVDLLLVGLCGAAVPSVLITVGEHHVETGLSSLLLASTPIWIAAGGHVLLPAERLRAAQTTCLAVALGGTALLTTGGHASGRSLWPLLPLAAAVSYACANLAVRSRLRTEDALTLTCAQMTVAAIVTAPFAAVHVPDIAWSPAAWAATAALGVVCSGFGWLANTVLVQRVSAVRASLVSFAAPVVSIALGAVVLEERLSPLQLAAAGIVLTAVAAFGAMSRTPRREVQAILELAILGFLAEHDMHAYELRRRITLLMGHARPVSDGSLYPALQRMRRRGLLAGRTEPGEGGPARQVFTLTGAGRTELLRRLTGPDDLEISDRNRYFVLLAFLHLLPSPEAQAAVLRRRLDFLDDPKRGFFADGDRPLRQDELASPFQAGIQHIARVTSAAERDWLAGTLATLRPETSTP